MLQKLHIEHFVLIDQLDIDFQEGFTVLTGETGAGKSIILGALSLILGGRADLKSIQQGAQRCVVEATFNIEPYHLEGFFIEQDLEFDPHQCIVRRELTAQGKSRAFVNDTPVNLTQLRELTQQLVDIHSQHQNLFLANEHFQRNIVDLFALGESDLPRYERQYDHCETVRAELKELKDRATQIKNDEDFLRFQYDQLHAADFKIEQQQELEQELETLNHNQEIESLLAKSDHLLNNEQGGITLQMRELEQTLRKVCDYWHTCNELTDRVSSMLIDVKELSFDLSKQATALDSDPNRKQKIEERLDLLYTLQRKHKCDSIQELLHFKEELGRSLASIELIESEIEEKEQLLAEETQKLRAMAEELSLKRAKSSAIFEKRLVEILSELSMPYLRFMVKTIPLEEPTRYGIDQISFLFSANRNVQLQPLASVASGGEIARLMLSIKCLAASELAMPTIIFDEIDTGVSGSIATKMANLLAQMSSHLQVITITHLPQIAARGDHHYKIYKTETEHSTESSIIELTPSQRVEEIARLVSGNSLTESALKHAQELLDSAANKG